MVSLADRRPTFLVIGAMKAGTTSLYEYLASHPDVFVARPKELDYFVEELNWGRGQRWYLDHFGSAPPRAIALGEASTSYTKYPRYRGVPERIARSHPDVRLVYVVRDPVERIRSHYDHNVVLGEESLPLERAVRANPAYLDYSRYATQLGQYLECFERDRVLVVTAEGLREHRTETVATVVSFVGADPNVALAGLDVEHYRTEARARYPRAVTATRGVLRRWVPDHPALWRGTFLPHRLKRVLARPPEASPRTVVPDETAAWIRRELRDEVHLLRAFLPDGFDAWGIAA